MNGGRGCVWASIVETGRARLPAAIGKPAFAAPKLTCGLLAESRSRPLGRNLYFQPALECNISTALDATEGIFAVLLFFAV